jgi:DNA invertase Pin-like site-specific DNA recombinase
MVPRTARNRVFSYRRFSTPEQALGDSIRRQDDAAARYCAQHGLVLDDELRLIDPGRSAFKGRHLDPERSALGQFMKRAESGELPRDTAALLVDDVSRLTRLGWLESANLLARILQTGIDVIFTDSGERITKQNFSRLSGALTYLLRAETAHGESADKSRKLSEVKEAQRAAIREGKRAIFTRALPSWIECHGAKLVEINGRIMRQGGKLRLIPRRAKVVKEIFERYASGEGKRAIAESLNARGEPTWGAFGAGRKPAKFWHVSYLHKILRSPAAMGTWVPRSHGKDQKPVPGYFPAAVSPELYQRVAELIRSAKPPGRGNREIKNMFSGIARCPVCGDALTRINKGRKGGEPRLVCVRARSGKGTCTYKSVRVSLVESALRAQVDVIERSLPITDVTLGPQIEQREAESAAVSAKLGKLADLALSGEDMPQTMIARMKELERRQAVLHGELEALRQRQAHSESSYVVRRVEELCAALRRTATAAEINAALRAVFGSIVVDYDLGCLECRWVHIPDGSPLLLALEGISEEK